MIYVLTVVHNNLKETKKLLASLYSQVYVDFEVVIVDDNSTDGLKHFIKNNYPQIKLLEGDGNLWWTGGLNLGLQEILKKTKREDYILTINNDCEFGRDYINQLLNTIKKRKKTIVGSLIVDRKNKRKIWDGGVKINWQKGTFYGVYESGVDLNKLNLRKNHIEENIDTITTKGTLFPQQVFKDLGMFDQRNFPHYFSDYEFGIRAKKRRWKLVIDYQAIVSNNIENTGFDYNKGTLTLKRVWGILFDKRSRVNIKDQINLIRVCCPDELKVNNYFLLLKRILHNTFRLMPL